MAHFAKIDENNIVVQVVPGPDNWLESSDKLPGTWIQTSYNTFGGVHRTGETPLRKNYAGIGFTYDEQRDAFLHPKPYASWILNEETCLWEAPVAKPEDSEEVHYVWNEETQSWDAPE